MDFKRKFFDLTGLIHQEFNRNKNIYGDKIKCGRGCSECCSQIFNITMLDSYIIQEHVKLLPKEKQAELKEKANHYIEQKRNIQISANTLHIPCPALGSEGECTIYEARPVICRRFGMPIYDYKNPSNINACHLNFRDSDEITDDVLIPNQTAIGKKWDELKDQFQNTLPKSSKAYTTIAESLIINKGIMI